MTTELTEDEWREATGYELIDWRRVFRAEGERDAAWDRFLDRVRRDAWQEGYDRAQAVHCDAIQPCDATTPNPYETGGQA